MRVPKRIVGYALVEFLLVTLLFCLYYAYEVTVRTQAGARSSVDVGMLVGVTFHSAVYWLLLIVVIGATFMGSWLSNRSA
jgi:uncharacterized membrane protein